MRVLLAIVIVVAALVARHVNSKIRLYSHLSLQPEYDRVGHQLLQKYRVMRAVAVTIAVAVTVVEVIAIFAVIHG